MNIFVTSYDITECAAHHCNVHRNKMIIEYAQLLSSYHHVRGTWTDNMYKPTHLHHPSFKWVLESKANYVWVYKLWSQLLNNYLCATGKAHASGRLLLDLYLDTEEEATFTYNMLAMPDEFKQASVVDSYRTYLTSKFNEWASRDKPIKLEWTEGKPAWLQ
jgi:hypothetical protein